MEKGKYNILNFKLYYIIQGYNMHNESYEEYIRSILGYPNYNNSSCCENDYNPNMASERNNETNRQLEACYPEIYKVVYPMINKACSNITKPITSDLIDELTNEIYSSIETDNEINLTINLTNKISSTGNRTTSNKTKTEKVQENRGEDRQFRNRGLQDLIRILLIRELLGRPGRFPPHRPPMRPPFPGRPGGGRPPIMPRDFNDFSNIYEV